MQRLIEVFRPDDGKDVVRVVAGILIAIGLLLVAIRRGTPEVFGEGTSNFGLFVILGAAAAFLYGAGILGRTLAGASRRWQALYTVTGMLIMPLALLQLIAAIDSSYDETLATLLVFSVCAAGCVAAWLIAAVRYQLLLASVYGAFAWLALLDKVLSDGLATDLDAVRGLLLLFAAGLVALAVLVRRRTTLDRDAAFGELLTGAGLAALLAYSLGPLLVLVAASVSPLTGSISGEIAGQSVLWDLLTLLTGTALVLFGLGRGLRGQVYVGTAMLILFILSAGLDLDDPSSPEGKLLGWPLLLCVLGAALFLVSLLPRERVPLAVGIGTWFGAEGATERHPIDGATQPAEPAQPGAAPRPADPPTQPADLPTEPNEPEPGPARPPPHE